MASYEVRSLRMYMQAVSLFITLPLATPSGEDQVFFAIAFPPDVILGMPTKMINTSDL